VTHRSSQESQERKRAELPRSILYESDHAKQSGVCEPSVQPGEHRHFDHPAVPRSSRAQRQRSASGTPSRVFEREGSLPLVWSCLYTAHERRKSSAVLLGGTPTGVLDHRAALDDAGGRGWPTERRRPQGTLEPACTPLHAIFSRDALYRWQGPAQRSHDGLVIWTSTCCSAGSYCSMAALARIQPPMKTLAMLAAITLFCAWAHLTLGASTTAMVNER
jgi:hypothetical protein